MCKELITTTAYISTTWVCAWTIIYTAGFHMRTLLHCKATPTLRTQSAMDAPPRVPPNWKEGPDHTTLCHASLRPGHDSKVMRLKSGTEAHQGITSVRSEPQRNGEPTSQYVYTGGLQAAPLVVSPSTRGKLSVQFSFLRPHAKQIWLCVRACCKKTKKGRFRNEGRHELK